MEVESFRAGRGSYPLKRRHPLAPAGTDVDTDLVTRAGRGDQAAFAKIASATHGRPHSLAYGILRDRAVGSLPRSG